MDWLGTNLPFKKLDHLLDSPFSLDLDRLYHLQRLSYQPGVYYRAITSDYLAKFLKGFDLRGMTTQQAVYGIEWLIVLCKECNTASKLSALPFEQMLVGSQTEVRNLSLTLLSRIFSLMVNKEELIAFSHKIHFVLINNLVLIKNSQNGRFSELEATLECLSLVDFGTVQGVHTSELDLKTLEELQPFLTDTSPKRLKYFTIKYLTKLAFFEGNRDVIYSSTVLDWIVSNKLKDDKFTGLCNVLVMDLRIKNLL